MELPPFLFLSIELLLLLLTSSYPQEAASRTHTNVTDLESLLAFKDQLGDPFGTLKTNWTTNTSFCSWVGVSCRRQGQRVTGIKLRNFRLQGTISSHLANLSFLSVVDLSNCSLIGSIPQVLGLLPRLKVLILQQNLLSGPVPSTIFNMSSLVTLGVATNNLSGSLPSVIMLPRLQEISVTTNQLTGEIPSRFAQCRGLRTLSLSLNEFTGSIPVELGSLPELRILYLGTNQLTEMIPTSLGNLTKLNRLDLSFNRLGGRIPREFGNLINLQYLILGANYLTGSIPISLLNASSLTFVEFALNNLTGPVPAILGESMPSLTNLLIGGNQLTGGFDFISSLSNCKDFVFLDFSQNQFEGILPNSIWNLSVHLQYFSAGRNNIRGNIPTSIGNLSSLIYLNLEENKLIGTVPFDIARLGRLQYMSLHSNRISGSVPSELHLMTSLNGLFLQNNKLVGHIPASLSNNTQLQHLSLSANKLSSSIPHELWSLTNLLELNLSQNVLDGVLPLQVGKLKALDLLDLSKNQLSGNIPSDLGKLLMLQYLDLSDNSFQDQIPQSLSGLINIKHLNLSHNFLTGVIPKSMANLPDLSSLDISFNKLEGQIPQGRVFSNLTIPSLEGNTALCGAPQLGFPLCSVNITTSHSRRKLHLLKYVLPVVASAIVVLASVCLVLAYYRRRKGAAFVHTDSLSLDDHRVVSYFEVLRATDNFNEASLLGRGNFGSVYRGCLDDGLIVAVKVLNLEVEGVSKSFLTECRALSTIRHRNLIKIISICSNLDFKALILEFMPNGSLDQWLYSDTHCLDLHQRLNIMVDVSSALEYLHHHHPHTVLHCDLKPSNILLDEDMIAHVGDFGIAKLLVGDSKSIASASTPGTIGYIAPEYGSTGTVSRMGDVYSFGILLLATFTGKKPTDVLFDGECSLREWICKAHPAALLDVVDSNLLKYVSSKEDRAATHQCISSIIELGLLCSRSSPMERIPMTDVVPRLQRIKSEYMVQKSTSYSGSMLRA